ncbi:hypothetical protein [Actinomyces succiniciruminis]|uniref:Uncharacterized protein n=1 Tax=Actinomyces succiniciruminis TaxID=1522002 RepID=A0A1L7RP72_9ACTO|nr:hypothetical protein [Actinomyces succiniciruminis]CED91308.1 Hypothetical protein AAM4_1476 [Actinomyces succiniciruminis]
MDLKMTDVETIADVVTMGVQGHDAQAVAERARRTQDTLQALRAGTAQSALAETWSAREVEPTLTAAGGDLRKLFDDRYAMGYLHSDLARHVDDDVYYGLDEDVDEEGNAITVVAPFGVGASERAQDAITELERVLEERGAIPDTQQRRAANRALWAQAEATAAQLLPEASQDTLHIEVDAIAGTARIRPDAPGQEEQHTITVTTSGIIMMGAPADDYDSYDDYMDNDEAPAQGYDAGRIRSMVALASSPDPTQTTTAGSADLATPPAARVQEAQLRGATL